MILFLYRRADGSAGEKSLVDDSAPGFQSQSQSHQYSPGRAERKSLQSLQHTPTRLPQSVPASSPVASKNYQLPDSVRTSQRSILLTEAAANTIVSSEETASDLNEIDKRIFALQNFLENARSVKFIK